VRKTQEVEYLRLAVSTPFAMISREATELDQACFVFVEFQVESGESFLHIFQKPLGIRTTLKTEDAIISETHYTHFTFCGPLSPNIDPDICLPVAKNIKEKIF